MVIRILLYLLTPLAFTRRIRVLRLLASEPFPLRFRLALNHPVLISFLETICRMESIEAEHSRGDNGSLESNEVLLRRYQMSCPSLAQLRHAVHASCENAQCGEDERDQKSLEFEACAELRVGRIQCVFFERSNAANGLEGEIYGQQDKKEEGEDLECETSKHDMVTNGGILALVSSCRSHATAHGLKDQAEEITGDEYSGACKSSVNSSCVSSSPWVQIRSQSAVFRTKSRNNSR
jgi:hypothetical protein